MANARPHRVDHPGWPFPAAAAGPHRGPACSMTRSRRGRFVPRVVPRLCFRNHRDASGPHRPRLEHGNHPKPAAARLGRYHGIPHHCRGRRNGHDRSRDDPRVPWRAGPRNVPRHFDSTAGRSRRNHYDRNRADRPHRQHPDPVRAAGRRTGVLPADHPVRARTTGGNRPDAIHRRGDDRPGLCHRCHGPAGRRSHRRERSPGRENYAGMVSDRRSLPARWVPFSNDTDLPTAAVRRLFRP